jgi:transposase-like protein
MDCPRCKNREYFKAGFANGCQRYKCKSCKYYYTVAQKSDLKSADTRRLAFEMYLEGMGFRAIGRVLKISYGTVYQWIRKWGKYLELPKRNESIKVVELDELHTYVGRKKTTDGYGLLLIDVENGLSLLCVETGQRRRD